MTQFFGLPPQAKRTSPHQATGSSLMNEVEMLLLQSAMNPSQVGHWSSDHRNEVRQYTGWNYLAIQPLIRAAQASRVFVYDDTDNPEARYQRQELKNRHGRKWRQFADASLVKTVDSKHRLYRLLTRPYPKLSGGQLRAEVIMHMHLHGGAMVWNIPNNLGNKTVRRLVIPPSLVTPYSPGQDKDMPNGGIWIHAPESMGYMPTLWAGYMGTISERRVPIEQLTIYRKPHPNLRGDGESPTHAIAAWLEILRNTESAQMEQMARGSDAKTLINAPDEVKHDTDALLAHNKKMAGWLRDTDSPLLFCDLAGGSASITLPADQMQYNETNTQYGERVLAAHGTGKAVLGMQDGMTYGSLGAALSHHDLKVAQPELNVLAEEDAADLEAEFEGQVSIEYEVQQYEDPELKIRALEASGDKGVITVREWREAIGLPPFGDERDEQLVGAGGESPAAASATQGETESQPPSFIPKHEPGAPPAIKIPASPPKPPEAPLQAPEKAPPSFIAKSYTIAIDLDGSEGDDWMELAKAAKEAGAGVVLANVRGEKRKRVKDLVMQANLEVDGLEQDWMGTVDAFYVDQLQVDSPKHKRIARFLDSIENPGMRGMIEKALSAQKPSIGGSVVAMLPSLGSIIEPIQESISDEDLAFRGMVNVFQCRLLGGIIGVEPTEVATILRPFTRCTARIDGLKAIPANSQRLTDLLVLDIRSEELRKIREFLTGTLPHEDEGEDVGLQVPIAFMRAGRAAEMVKTTAIPKDLAVEITKLVFVEAEGGRKFSIPLASPRISVA